MANLTATISLPGIKEIYEILSGMVYCRICGTVYYGRTAGICNACHNELEPFANIITPKKARRRTKRAGDTATPSDNATVLHK